jgi:hypothetical protein
MNKWGVSRRTDLGRRRHHGVVGVIGTSSLGPVGVPITLSSMAEANDLFGVPDSFAVPTDGSNPLTLTRALQYAHGNSAGRCSVTGFQTP